MRTAKTFASSFVIGIGGLCLAVGAVAPVMAQSTVSTGVGTPFELAFWQSVDNSTDPTLYEKYLAHYPNGTFSEIAQAKLVSLRGRAAAPATPAAPVLMSPATPAVQSTPLSSSQPAPVATIVVQPAVPAAPQPTVAPPVEPAHLTPAVDTIPVPASGAATFAQQLAALAAGQRNEDGPRSVTGPVILQPALVPTGPAPIAPMSGPQHANTLNITMPPQPALSPVAALAFPPSFCSAEQRNAFHEQVYAPTVNTAQHNNEAAAAYLRQLQALYDQYQLSRDPDTMNAIAEAARQYEQVAHNAFAMQAGLVQQFGALMAVPVVACAQPAKPTAAVLVK